MLNLGALLAAAVLASSGIHHVTVHQSCARAVDQELIAIATRLKNDGTQGVNATATARRLKTSGKLAEAVAAGDPAATAAALKRLVLHQVVTAEVWNASDQPLAKMGSTRALQPTQVTLTRQGKTVGTARFSVLGRASFEALANRLTGARVRIDHHSAKRSAHLKATSFDGVPVDIQLELPTAKHALCGADTTDTQLKVIQSLARRVIAGEAHSEDTMKSLQRVAGDPIFQRAARTENPKQLRAAVVEVFQDHRFHIVRVRLTKQDRLIYDLGGPDVLAPVSTRIGNKLITLSVQDDSGVIKLINRFTGAFVTMTDAHGTVPESISPAPNLQTQSRSFTTKAFPSGRLTIKLALPV